LREAREIINTAHVNAENYRKQAQVEIDETMRRREEQLRERVARMEQNAIQEIQARAAELAMHATARLIEERLDRKGHERLLDEAIDTIEDCLQ
jgi:F-type H+-transporting ATPase subunit b